MAEHRFDGLPVGQRLAFALMVENDLQSAHVTPKANDGVFAGGAGHPEPNEKVGCCRRIVIAQAEEV